MRKRSKEDEVSSLRQCGACVWFVTPQGQSGLTCPEHTGVAYDSVACKDFLEPPFNVARVKETDAFLQAFRKSLLEPHLVIDSSVEVELQKYFVLCLSTKEGGKKLRTVPVCSYGPKEGGQLAQLLIEAQAFRDRVLSIRLGFLSLMTELKTKEALGQQYLYERYNKELQEMKSSTIRDTVCAILLAPLNTQMLKVEHLLKISDLVYQNLKDTYFTLKEVKETMCAFITSTRMQD